jgi:YTH domain-containing family protein
MDSFVYVPWYSPQFCKGVWYHNYVPVPVLMPENAGGAELGRTKTPLQALDTTHLPSITSPELQSLNTTEFELFFRGKGKFIVMLSACEDDIHKSLKYGIWTSTPECNHFLHTLFLANRQNEPIYMFFSVFGSEMFVGMAEMISAVNFNASFNGWYPEFSNPGYFSVRWIYVKDIAFGKVKHIRIYQGQPITKAGDCQDVPRNAALKLTRIFAETKQFRSVLEDFKYYDDKEKVVLSTLDN